MLDVQDDFAGGGGLFVNVEIDVAADHHGGQLFHRGVFCFHRPDVFPLAQNRTAVSHSHDLRQLMADKEDGFSFCGKVPHDLHQFFDLLRGQHGCGLVKDQDLVVTVQHLEDLGALLHTNGDIFDLRVRIHLEAILFRKGDDFLPCLFLLQESKGADRFNAHDDVVQDCEALHQFEMLMHHADAQVVGVVGIVDPDLDSVLFDRSFFRLIQAEKHAHQSGFTRAVFSQKRMDLPMPELKRDIIVGDDPRESFCNMQHFNGIFTLMHLFQCAAPAFMIVADSEPDVPLSERNPCLPKGKQGLLSKTGDVKHPRHPEKSYLMLP